MTPPEQNSVFVVVVGAVTLLVAVMVLALGFTVGQSVGLEASVISTTLPTGETPLPARPAPPTSTPRGAIVVPPEEVATATADLEGILPTATGVVVEPGTSEPTPGETLPLTPTPTGPATLLASPVVSPSASPTLGLDNTPPASPTFQVGVTSSPSATVRPGVTPPTATLPVPATPTRPVPTQGATATVPQPPPSPTTGGGYPEPTFAPSPTSAAYP